jgi:hypothetical protein
MAVYLMIIHHWKLSYSVKEVSAHVTFEIENNILIGLKNVILQFSNISYSNFFIVLSNFKSELSELTMWVRMHQNHCS